MDKYVFRPYDNIFPELFLKEKGRLASSLGDGMKIEHVGSTAVPGLGGKGFIDLLVGTEDDDLASASGKIVGMGYEYRPDVGTNERWYHELELPDEKQGQRWYHIHVTKIGSKDWEEMLAFRDLLRTDASAFAKYAEVKKHAAKIANQQREIYVATKDPIILELTRQTLAKKSD